MTRIHFAWLRTTLPLILAFALLPASLAGAEPPAEESKPAAAGSDSVDGATTKARTTAAPEPTADAAGTPTGQAAPVGTRGTSAHVDSMTDRSSSSGPDMIERHETHMGEDGSTTTITTVTDDEGNTHQAVLRREADGTVTESNTTQPADQVAD